MARVIVFVADLSTIVARTEPRAGLRWADPSDVAALAEAGFDGSWATEMLEQEARICVAEDAGRIVGFNAYLLQARVRQYSWLTLAVRPGRDFVAIGSEVVPARRGEGWLPAMKGFAARRFLADGYERMVSCTRSRNRASVRSHAHVGARPAVRLNRHRLGRLMLVWQGWRLRHVSWGRGRSFELCL